MLGQQGHKGAQQLTHSENVLGRSSSYERRNHLWHMLSRFRVMQQEISLLIMSRLRNLESLQDSCH